MASGCIDSCAAHGIESRVVDSASIEVRRRARRARPTGSTHRSCQRCCPAELGEKEVWSVVYVPSVADEDAGAPARVPTLVKERSTLRATGSTASLASQGLAWPARSKRGCPQWLTVGATLGWLAGADPGCETGSSVKLRRRQLYSRPISCPRAERRGSRRGEKRIPELSTRSHAARRSRGIGLGAAWTYGLEFFTWRSSVTAKQVGALSGAGVPPRLGAVSWSTNSGSVGPGNRGVRGLAIEIAWGSAVPPSRQAPPLNQQRFAREDRARARSASWRWPGSSPSRSGATSRRVSPRRVRS